MITPYLYVPFAAWALAQLLKFSIALVRGKADLRYLYASGGMPSVHSAVVCSLAAYALFAGGAMSPLFGITAVFAAIVMYDSFGVRRSTGEQAKTINQLITELGRTGSVRDTSSFNNVREILGHKPFEVLVGAILGIATAAAFSWDTIVPYTESMGWYARPLDQYLLLGKIGGGLLLIIGLYVFWVRKFAKPQRRAAVKWLLMFLFAIALLGFEYLALTQRVAYFGTRGAEYIGIVLALVIGVVAIWKIFQLSKQSKSATKTEGHIARKDAWLKKAKKKSRK